MSDVNSINKISITGPISINRINMTTMLFIDNLAVSKSRYSILNKYLNILETATETISLYHNVNSCEYFEYQVNLHQNNTTIAGLDRYGNRLTNLNPNKVIVFVNGYKLLNTEFQVVSQNSIVIFPKFVSERISTIIIYASDKIEYCGNPFNKETWDPIYNQLEISDYDETRYIFFKNGELINYENLTKLNEYVRFNFKFETSDAIEYYQLPNDTSVCMFDAQLGYTSYGPIDKHRKELPLLSNCIVTFEKPVRLIINDIREGFFIKEETGTGSLIILDNDFDSRYLNCIIITEFAKSYYENSEYFVQVPETTSILKYTSEFDLNGRLFPEILGIFQRVLLDETYDSLQRLKNIRNINKVDTQNLSALINFLGLNIKINNITPDQKRRLLDELNNFYNIAGTKASYNFYNFLTEGSSLIKLEQLFTPIKDNNSKANPLKRYVNFKPAEDFDTYQYHREYKIPTTDYGSIEEIASPSDIWTNTPKSEGITVNENKVYSPEGLKLVYVTDETGDTVQTYKYMPANPYRTQPVAGPNSPTIDYGWISDAAVDFIDYGSIEDKIQGEWIEWFDWERDKDWYPTNHVNAYITIPVDINYTDFMEYFMKLFYKIASTVVYLHSVIQIYSFGPDDKIAPTSSVKSSRVNIFTTPVYNRQEYTFTSDPLRQPDKHWRTTPDPNWRVSPAVENVVCDFERRKALILEQARREPNPDNWNWIPTQWKIGSPTPVVENPCPQEFQTHDDFEKCTSIIFKDIDYLMFGFDHIPGHGKHLDLYVRITNSSLNSYNKAVGRYASSQAKVPNTNQKLSNWDDDINYDPNCLMQWCRHNQGNHEGSPYYYTIENVVVNLTNFGEEPYKNYFGDVINFDLYCAFNNWNGGVDGLESPHDVSIVLRGYKNGNVKYYTHTQYREHDIYQYDFVDDNDNIIQPKYGPVYHPLENVCITEAINVSIPTDKTPETYTDETKRIIRKVATVQYVQSTKKVDIQIVPKQDS